MKKIILFLSLASFFLVGNSFAKTISIDDVNTGDIIILDEGKNTINASNNTGNYLFIPNKDYSTNPSTGAIYGSKSDIEIECKNGYFANVIGGNSVSDAGNNGNIDFSSYMLDTLDLGKYDGSYNNTFAKIKCKPITSPDELVTAPDINYETINTKDGLESFSISNRLTEITGNSIENQLAPKADIASQPTFLDVLYLQLKTISYLTDSVLLKNNNLNFKDLFYVDGSVDKFDEYEKWISKFSTYSDKKTFQDAFSGAVTLKDVGIAQDIVLGLYDCLDKNADENECKGIINFKSINDRTDVYKLEEIENNLYGGSKTVVEPVASAAAAIPTETTTSVNNNTILDYSLTYYEGLHDVCSNITVTDAFIKSQIDGLCSLLISDATENIDKDYVFNLGYALETRIANLTNIKENIPTGGLNLKGIYNIYRELNNLSLGLDKLEIVNQINESTDLTKQYDLLKKTFELDKNELSDAKIIDSDLLKKTEFLEEYIDIENKDVLDTIDSSITDYSNLDLIRDDEGKDALKVDGVILSFADYKLVGKSDYSDDDDGLKIGTGSVVYNSINSHCYPSGDKYDKSFPDGCSNTGKKTGEVGTLGFDFSSDKFKIGDKVGIFLDNEGNNEGDDYLYYKGLNLGIGFRIELGVRGGALLRDTNENYVLFRIPWADDLHLELTSFGSLHAGYYTCPGAGPGCHENLFYKKLDSSIIDKDKFYKVVFTLDGTDFNLKVVEYDTNDIVYEVNSSTIFPIEVDSDYKIYIGNNNGYDQWNDLIDYIKIYKKIEE